jgi:GxxExxY protein
MPTDTGLAEVGRLLAAVEDAAREAHRTLGPGLGKAPYVDALCRRLASGGLAHRCGVWLPERYRNLELSCGHSLDVVVEGRVVVEAVSAPDAVAQRVEPLRDIVRLGKFGAGLLVNFHAHSLRHAMVRVWPDNALAAAS